MVCLSVQTEQECLYPKEKEQIKKGKSTIPTFGVDDLGMYRR